MNVPFAAHITKAGLRQAIRETEGREPTALDLARIENAVLMDIIKKLLGQMNLIRDFCGPQLHPSQWEELFKLLEEFRNISERMWGD